MITKKDELQYPENQDQHEKDVQMLESDEESVTAQEMATLFDNQGYTEQDSVDFDQIAKNLQPEPKSDQNDSNAHVSVSNNRNNNAYPTQSSGSYSGKYGNYIGYSVIDNQKIVLVTGTLSRIRYGRTRRGNAYVALSVSLYKSSDRLKQVWQGNSIHFPDAKYSTVTMVAYNDPQGMNASFVYHMGLKASQFNNNQLTELGDQVTMVGYHPTANQYTNQKTQRTYYTYNMSFMNVFKNSMSNGVRPLFVANTKRGRKWTVLMRGKLATLPKLYQTQKGTEFAAMKLCIENDPNVYKGLHTVTNDNKNLLPQHNAESPYFIDISAWKGGKDYVMSRKWQKNDVVEVLGVVSGLNMPKDVEHEPHVSMFANSIRQIRSQNNFSDQQSVNVNNIPDPWSDSNSEEGTQEINLDETGLI